MNKNKKWRGVVIAVAAVLIIVVLVLAVGRPAADESMQLQASAQPSATPQPMPTPSATPAATPEPAPVALRESDRDIDFDALKAQNPDVIAWLTVPGTEIDFPLLKSRDNFDYLYENIDREEDVKGAIFMDTYNQSDFSDRFTVLYGHNMADGSMFAPLHQFEDADFFAANRYIKIYTPEGMYVYEIFAAHKWNDQHLLSAYDFNSDFDWQKHLNEIYASLEPVANRRYANISEEDKILTLSTCVTGEDDRRYLVQALLTYT